MREVPSSIGTTAGCGVEECEVRSGLVADTCYGSGYLDCGSSACRRAGHCNQNSTSRISFILYPFHGL